MTTAQSVGFIEVKDILELAAKAASQHKSCFSCNHCDVEENLCRHWKSTPPMKIIKVGCPAYEIDVPF